MMRTAANPSKETRTRLFFIGDHPCSPGIVPGSAGEGTRAGGVFIPRQVRIASIGTDLETRHGSRGGSKTIVVPLATGPSPAGGGVRPSPPSKDDMGVRRHVVTPQVDVV